MTWDDPCVSTLVAYRRWPPTAHVRETGGPSRVEVEEHPEFKPTPVGFAPPGRHRRNVPVDSDSLAGFRSNCNDACWGQPCIHEALYRESLTGRHRRWWWM